MNGREVFRHAVQKISGVIEETLVMTGYAPDEIDLYVPHQANKRILDGIAKRLGIPQDKIVLTLAKHGNTSAASIPLALNQAFEDHRLDGGQAGADGGDGRRLHLGRRAGAVVMLHHALRFMCAISAGCC